MVLLVAIICLIAYSINDVHALPTAVPISPGCTTGAIPNNIITTPMLPGAAVETYPVLGAPFINNIQVTPTISELVPSLQYGDLTMGGELPIGGTIKVCGCFPVYGMIAVDGAVPSAGTALVDDTFGRQPFEVRCGPSFY